MVGIEKKDKKKKTLVREMTRAEMNEVLAVQGCAPAMNNELLTDEVREIIDPFREKFIVDEILKTINEISFRE